MPSQLHDLAIARHAAHAGELDAGRRACERLLARELPPRIESEARAARTWYIEPLEEVVRTTTLRRRIDCEPARQGWTLFNPTILDDRRGGYWVLVRSSNYRIAADGAYVVPPEDQGEHGPWIRTRHILTHCPSDGESGEPAHLLGPDWETNAIQITGMEDLRLRWDGERIVASGTVLNAAHLPVADNGWPIARIATATLLPDAGLLCDFECHEGPYPERHEKNWVPIEGMPGTWLYAANEAGHVATVSRGDLHAWTIQCRAKSCPALRHLRGRSQLVQIPTRGDGGQVRLGIFGEATDDGRRMYDHRFVAFAGEDLEPLAWSRPFRFGALRGVEFCAGLAYFPGEEVLRATYGIRDEEAWVATMSIWGVLDSLGPIPC